MRSGSELCYIALDSGIEMTWSSGLLLRWWVVAAGWLGASPHRVSGGATACEGIQGCAEKVH